jgi:hypothetical protein
MAHAGEDHGPIAVLAKPINAESASACESFTVPVFAGQLAA